MAKVKLRIVGLYFNSSVTIDDAKIQAGVSVKNVLDTYVALKPVTEAGGLAYAVKQDFGDPLSRPYESVLSFTHNFVGRYDFDGNGSTADTVDGPTLSGSDREEGIYKLQEGTIAGVTSGVLGWQYYVESFAGVLKSKTVRGASIDKGFNYFAEVPEAPEKRIADGDTITWRLVAILLGASLPGKAPRVLRISDKLDTRSLRVN